MPRRHPVDLTRSVEAALAHPEAQRAGFLTSACHGGDVLRREVQRGSLPGKRLRAV